MRRLPAIVCLAVLFPVSAFAEPVPPGHPRPAMRDFIGLNVHTVQFKPDLYAPICRLVRDYHPMNWDVGDDPTYHATFPLARNKVDWDRLYGSWRKVDFVIDACLMFDQISPDRWRDSAAEAKAYGEAFARYFGPSGAHPLVNSAEIGNEPANYGDSQYLDIFKGMSQGLRAGDPKLKVVTCAVMTGKPDQWSKPVDALADLRDAYDVLNLHTYAFKEKWPTFRRSYPEDPSIAYLRAAEDLIAWRDAHAPDKEVWVTEFGYDSATKPPDPKGPWAKWVGVTDAEQARYVVRSYLLFSAMDVSRAYLYFFNDKDEPQLHGASGLTRNFQPKPSFHAVAHLYRTLGDYRFNREVSRGDEVYCFEYVKADAPAERVYVAWSPTATPDAVNRSLPIGPGAYRAQRMPLAAGDPPAVEWKPNATGVEIAVGGDPVYIWAKSN